MNRQHNEECFVPWYYYYSTPHYTPDVWLSLAFDRLPFLPTCALTGWSRLLSTIVFARGKFQCSRYVAGTLPEIVDRSQKRYRPRARPRALLRLGYQRMWEGQNTAVAKKRALRLRSVLHLNFDGCFISFTYCSHQRRGVDSEQVESSYSSILMTWHIFLCVRESGATHLFF